MRHIFAKGRTIAGAALFAFALALPVTAFALPNQAGTQRVAAQESQQTGQTDDTVTAAQGQNGNGKLLGAQLKACQNKEKAVKNIPDHFLINEIILVIEHLTTFLTLILLKEM